MTAVPLSNTLLCAARLPVDLLIEWRSVVAALAAVNELVGETAVFKL